MLRNRIDLTTFPLLGNDWDGRYRDTILGLLDYIDDVFELLAGVCEK